MKKQLWKTKKEKGLNPAILEYISGEDLKVDKNLISYDIKVNKAHAKMLAKCNLISWKDYKKIKKALNEIPKDFELKKELEDVHMNIEHYLIKKLGHIGEKIHAGKSRNDQVMTDLQLFMKDKISGIEKDIKSLQKIMKNCAKKYKNYEMPAYTHMQPAQAITFGYWFEAYIALLNDDLIKLKDCLKWIDVSPLGAGAVAGTSLPIDKNFTTKKLGFSKTFENALATISSRGENETSLLFCFSMLMLHLNKMATDLQLYSTKEFGMIKLDDSITTGSSMLPQKKNPDVLEIVKAKTAEIFSLLIENLFILKNLPSGYNKDMQLTKKTLMQGIEIVEKTLQVMKIVLEKITPDKEKMKELAKNCKAIEKVNKLVLKGIPFRAAHKKVRCRYINL